MMPSSSARVFFLAACCAVFAATLAVAQRGAPLRRQLLIVVDGLRPDYVTSAVMPNLTALAARGVIFTRHHSVYPTVTRVNASSISTGAYPATHGLMGNSVFFPRVNAAAFLDTADREALLKVASVEGRLLTAPTLAESLQAAGRRLLVVSSGSAGSALLLNHSGAGGAILHAQFTLPTELGAALATIGPPPGDKAPLGVRDAYVTDAFLKVGIPRVDPTVSILWFGELDATAHDHGIGHQTTVDVLKNVDAQIKRVEEGLAAAGLAQDFTIWVTSDHGFSTYTGAPRLDEVMRPFVRALPDGRPHVVQSGGAIYLQGDDADAPAIVSGLQRTPGVGAIFTRAAKPGSFDGAVPGTLSFDAVRWNHDRAAAILFSPDWTDAVNAFGMRGSTTSNGTAGHGSTSPWDVHNTLIAAGPDVKRSVSIAAPSANVDLAPTLLKVMGLPIPAAMEGRVLDEALANGKPLPAGDVRALTHVVKTTDGAYTLTGAFSVVRSGGRDYRYFDSTTVVRK